MLCSKDPETQVCGAKLDEYLKVVVMCENFTLAKIPTMAVELYTPMLLAFRNHQIHLEYDHAKAVFVRFLTNFVSSEGLHVPGTASRFFELVMPEAKDSKQMDLDEPRLRDLPVVLKTRASLFCALVVDHVIVVFLRGGEAKASQFRSFLICLLQLLEGVDRIDLSDAVNSTITGVLEAARCPLALLKRSVLTAADDHDDVSAVMQYKGLSDGSPQTAVANGILQSAYYKED
jgi:hypothetical protein